MDGSFPRLLQAVAGEQQFVNRVASNVCIDGNRHLSLVAVDAGLSISSRSAILTLWTETDKIFVRIGKSEATEVQFAKRCDPNQMDAHF